MINLKQVLQNISLQENLSYLQARTIAQALLPIPPGENEQYFLPRHIEGAIASFDTETYTPNIEGLSQERIDARCAEIMQDPELRNRFHLAAAISYCQNPLTPHFFEKFQKISDVQNEVKASQMLTDLMYIVIENKIEPAGPMDYFHFTENGKLVHADVKKDEPQNLRLNRLQYN